MGNKGRLLRIELLTQMIKNKGFGASLRDGLKQAAAAVGGGAEAFLVHVKGTGKTKKRLGLRKTATRLGIAA